MCGLSRVDYKDSGS